MSSIGADAVTRAENVAMCADIACALSVEALKGTPRSFEPCIHAVRPHQGQVIGGGWRVAGAAYLRSTCRVQARR